MIQQQLVDVPATPPPAPPQQRPGRGRYPLQVEQWGEDGDTLLSRGHHDPEAFRLAAQMFCVDELDDYRWAGRVAGERVYREWWRHQPSRTMGRGTEWEGMRSYKIVDGPGPGAFPVTYVSVD